MGMRGENSNRVRPFGSLSEARWWNSSIESVYQSESTQGPDEMVARREG